jgi:iron complex outermembrane receptor protein
VLGSTDTVRCRFTGAIRRREISAREAVGAKGRTAGGRLQFDASVYQINWSDIQQRILMSGCALAFVTNEGTARSRGFDLSTQALVTDHLTLGLTLGYTDAVATETIRASNGTPIIVAGYAIGGQPMFAISPWQASLSATEEFTALGHDFYARADYQYQSRDPITALLDCRTVNSDTGWGRNPELRFLSTRLGMRVEGWDVSPFVDKVLNDSAALIHRRDNNLSPLFYESALRPRTLGITGTFRF